jgi:hypothetical protein
VEDNDSIVKKVHQELTNIRSNIWNLNANAKRVIFFYKCIFRYSPTVVIAVSERTVGRIYADVTAAARTLSDKEFDLRIIIDGSPNSIAPELKNTTRECVIQIERMERTMIENIEEFTSLMSFLKKEQIDDGVWEVFGGTPTLYIQLADIVVELKKFNYQSDAIKVYIQNFMYSYLLKSFNGILMQNSHNK